MQSGERGRSLDGSPPESVCLDRPANQPIKGVSNQPSSAAWHALAAGGRLTEPWSEPYLFAGGSDGESSAWTHLLCGRSGDDGCVGRIRGAGRRTQSSGNCAPDCALTGVYLRQIPSLTAKHRETCSGC